MDITSANREVYELIKGGVSVSVPDHERGGQKEERVRVVDWENPTANDFLAVRQITFTGVLYTCRPDIVGYVNGLPWVVIELKKPGVPARQAFDDNLTSYKHIQNGIPQLFWYNALLVASNGTESRVGSITADWDRFFEWKRIEREDEPRTISLETVLRGTCDKSRLLDLAENFTLFSEHRAGLVKILGQNHQYLGVNNTIQATLKARQGGHGRGGVFWQTQGSGKSFSMVFYAQKILRRIPGNWTFVVVTDRVELDDQIAKTFAACGAVSDANECHAASGADLRRLLKENHRYVFTLIHKFQTAEELCDRPDVIVLTDEAHRSQYDTMAMNMRKALPKALFLAFTGTPLIAGEERTKEVFGDYVSIYDFQQSVEDGATVPLYYENRTPELRLENPRLNDDIYELIEKADLNEAQENRLERELGRQYHIITRDDRLETIAKDIVRHFLGRGFVGKAMVVSIDKATAARMYAKVKKNWNEEKVRVEKELKQFASAAPDLNPEKIRELQGRYKIIIETDMALVVSPGQNEIEDMKELGIDIVPHRERMQREKLDEKFKDTSDPLRLVFVCAMWLTGFDAPSCSTIYLDKPMRNHTLMQTIARANRVFPGKYNGLIVDYANVFASLERALAIYGQGKGGENPVEDKSKLVAELRSAVAAVSTYCKNYGVDPDAIEKTPATSLDRLIILEHAVESLVSPETVRNDYLNLERYARTLFQAVKPDPVAYEHASKIYLFRIIADMIREFTGTGGPVDISGVMGQITGLLDDSIAAQGFIIPKTRGSKESSVIDLSQIDFEALAKKFKASKSRNIELERLKAAIRFQLEQMIRLNKHRVDFLEKFEELIDSYNAGSRNIDELFRELLRFSKDLSDEQKRHVRENLSEEELVIFDILTRPEPKLSDAEKNEVKKVACQLMERIKGLLVIGWKQTVQSRARIKVEIQKTLDAGLPNRAYPKEIYDRKCSAVFEHVYENYYGEGQSVFNHAQAFTDRTTSQTSKKGTVKSGREE